MADSNRNEGSGTRDDDLERYESWRHQPSRVPSRSYVDYRDRAARAGHGEQWSTRRGLGSQERGESDDMRFDVHGGNAGDEPEDHSETYTGRMRQYRHTPAGFRVEQGPYQGQGPRNYRRSDERIREDVCDLLTEDGLVDASGLTVEAQGGEVTLEGSVGSREQKRRAEDLAERISGVCDVHNRLKIEPGRH